MSGAAYWYCLQQEAIQSHVTWNQFLIPLGQKISCKMFLKSSIVIGRKTRMVTVALKSFQSSKARILSMVPLSGS